jgi:hypothetical protein
MLSLRLTARGDRLLTRRYRVRSDRVEVLRIIHGARQLPPTVQESI